MLLAVDVDEMLMKYLSEWQWMHTVSWSGV